MKSSRYFPKRHPIQIYIIRFLHISLRHKVDTFLKFPLNIIAKSKLFEISPIVFLSSGIAWIIGQFDQYVRSEASSIMRALSGARCTGVRLYTLWIKIGTNQRALGEHSHYWTRLWSRSFLNSLIESRMSYSRMIGSRIQLDANNLDDPLYIIHLWPLSIDLWSSPCSWVEQIIYR